ncbi:hypothetical protein C8Q74DRAFT_490748 [Fomes fomentarius]|nr:hypothetical protein C8Q74DRAFT_490748 [Fomes fomentarius]
MSLSNPLAQSSSSSDRAVNVVYILSSDSEEEDTKVNVNVLLSPPHRRLPRSPPSDQARARNHGEDDQRADPPPPNQGIRRARDEVDGKQDLDETLPSARTSGKLRADGAPRKYSVLGGMASSEFGPDTLEDFQMPATPKTSPSKRHVPDPEDEAEEDIKPEVIYISSDSEPQPPIPASLSSRAPSGSACLWIRSSSRPSHLSKEECGAVDEHHGGIHSPA